MAQTATIKTWLYLARRDGKGVRILMSMNARSQPPARLPDIGMLQLPFDVQAAVGKIIEQDRMMWEPWVESAADYETLKKKLKGRGYTGLPLNGQPEFTGASLVGGASVTSLPKKQSMLRKKA